MKNAAKPIETNIEVSPNDTSKPVELKARFAHQQPAIWQEAFRLARRRDQFLALSLVFNLLLVALAIVLQGRPAHVILVDKLGHATWYNESASPEPPQDYEAESFATTWVKDFLSRDAITAKEDMARALSVTYPELQKKLVRRLQETGELEKVRDAFVHSTVRIESSSVAKSAKDRLEVTIKGARTLTPIGVNNQSLSDPFEFQLVLSGVPRTKNTPNGLMVRYISGGLIDKEGATN